MPYGEDDLLAISALQHLAFCERQCALIHIEQAWAENRLTAEGRLMHERVHGQETEARGDLRIVRGLRLRSLALGLAGVADAVEFHRIPELAAGDENSGGVATPDTVALPDCSGLWRPFPVEYKHGRPKRDRCDDVQLCAQAICLEEMLGVVIESGALYYGQTRRRHDVAFTPALRGEVASLARRLHALIDARHTPLAHYEKKCDNCSLLEICMPKALNIKFSASAWLEDNLRHLSDE